MWIGLGIGGAVLLLCCVGGIFGIGALVVENARAVQAEATSVVNDYLGALHDRDYRRAYDDLCDQLQAQTSYESFVNTETEQTPISSYTVEAPRVQGSNVLVFATVTRQDGSTQTPEYKLTQTGQAVAALKICGIAQ
jgi:hypothetical protein